jgi:hypothetical protein
MFRKHIAGPVLAAAVAIMITAAHTSAASGGAARPRFKAVAFDYLVLFDPDSVVSEVEQIVPGQGRQLTDVWRTRQFEYAWLRSTYKPDPHAYQLGVDRLHYAKQEILFAAFGGWDAAGAKLFGYPTVWVNRFNQPLEELGVRPDRVVTNLNGLLEFALSPPRTK